MREDVEKYPFSRTRTYEFLKYGKLKANKLGKQTLIDCESADVLLKELPQYKSQTSGDQK
jgi:hypothetical protein